MADYYKYPLWQSEESQDSSIFDLENELLCCRQCLLREDCIAPTSFNGSITSPLMLIAEGPGGVEDEYGVPLVGKSGQLLDKALWSAQITRDRIYTSNVVKCRPLKNRTPTLEESLFCATKWLAKEIEIIQPKVILCLGSISLKFFGGKELKITQERGKWLANRFGVNIIATFHPAYLIRLGGEQLKKAKWDMYYDILAAKNKVLEYYPDYQFTSDEITPLLKIFGARKEYRTKTYLTKE